MLTVKQGGIKYHFLSLGMTRLGIEPRSPRPLANILLYLCYLDEDWVAGKQTGLLNFILDPYLIMLTVKQGGIKYHFLSLWYDSTWNWTQVSRTIGKHSTIFVCYLDEDWVAGKQTSSLYLFVLLLFSLALFFFLEHKSSLHKSQRLTDEKELKKAKGCITWNMNIAIKMKTNDLNTLNDRFFFSGELEWVYV